MLIKVQDVPLAFAALTISLLIFAVAWTAPVPQLCPTQQQQTAAVNQAQASAVLQPLSQSGEPATQKKNNGCDEHAITDWWTIRIGLLTLFVLAGQLLMFWRQLNAMRAGVKDAADAAIAAAKQAEIANREYIAGNRPRIRVRLISIDAPVLAQPIVVRFEIINVGGTGANILSVDVTLRIDVPPYAQQFNGLPPTVTRTRQIPFTNFLAQGESLPAIGQIADFDPAWGYLVEDGPWWSGRLFVIGVIRYLDGNGVRRQTAFYRRATNDRNRFELMNFSDAQRADHEYED